MIIKFPRTAFMLSFFCFSGVLFGFPGISAGQPAGILEKAFFYNDIYNFSGQLVESPAFSQVRSFSQPFVSQCANLNRIVLSFYVKTDHGNGALTFNLYQAEKERRLIFSAPIRLAEFPKSEKIGTYSKEGVLHHIWLPPGIDSRKNELIWEVVGDENQDLKGVGLYLTDSHSPRLTPVSISGVAQKDAYAAFYSYCRFAFDWNEILKATWGRVTREKYFLGFYLLLVGAVGFFVATRKPGREKSGFGE